MLTAPRCEHGNNWNVCTQCRPNLILPNGTKIGFHYGMPVIDDKEIQYGTYMRKCHWIFSKRKHFAWWMDWTGSELCLRHLIYTAKHGSGNFWYKIVTAKPVLPWYRFKKQNASITPPNSK